MTRTRLDTLRQQAVVLYRDIDAHYDRFDCGMALADEISPTGPRLKRRFNAIWSEIRSLDASAPESPFA